MDGKDPLERIRRPHDRSRYVALARQIIKSAMRIARARGTREIGITAKKLAERFPGRKFPTIVSYFRSAALQLTRSGNPVRVEQVGNRGINIIVGEPQSSGQARRGQHQGREKSKDSFLAAPCLFEGRARTAHNTTILR